VPLLWKSSSSYSLAHILPTSSSKSAPATVSYTFCRCPHLPKLLRSLRFSAILPLQSHAPATASCTFCRRHLPKALWTWHFFNIFKCKSRPRYSPVHFLSTTLPDRAPELQKPRPSFRDPTSHFTGRNTGFRAHECFDPWLHAFPSCYSSTAPTRQLLLLTLLLTWWCWHEDDMMPRLPLDIRLQLGRFQTKLPLANRKTFRQTDNIDSQIDR